MTETTTNSTDAAKTDAKDTNTTEKAATPTFKGTVKSFDSSKKYGFITQDDGKEIFLHQEALPEGVTVAVGDNVSYDVTQGAKGPRAAAVRKL